MNDRELVLRGSVGRVRAFVELVRKMGTDLHVATRELQAGVERATPAEAATAAELDLAASDLVSAALGLRGTTARTNEAAAQVVRKRAETEA